MEVVEGLRCLSADYIPVTATAMMTAMAVMGVAYGDSGSGVWMIGSYFFLSCFFLFPISFLFFFFFLFNFRL